LGGHRQANSDVARSFPREQVFPEEKDEKEEEEEEGLEEKGEDLFLSLLFVFLR